MLRGREESVTYLRKSWVRTVPVIARRRVLQESCQEYRQVLSADCEGKGHRPSGASFHLLYRTSSKAARIFCLRFNSGKENDFWWHEAGMPATPEVFNGDLQGQTYRHRGYAMQQQQACVGDTVTQSSPKHTKYILTFIDCLNMLLTSCRKGNIFTMK